MNNNKIKKFFVILVSIAVILILSVIVIGNIELNKQSSAIQKAEQTYLNEPSYENLDYFCGLILDSKDYAKIVQYVPEILKQENNIITKGKEAKFDEEKIAQSVDSIWTMYLFSLIKIQQNENFTEELQGHFHNFKTDEFKYHLFQTLFEDVLDNDTEQIMIFLDALSGIQMEQLSFEEQIKLYTFQELWYKQLGETEKAQVSYNKCSEIEKKYYNTDDKTIS